MAMAFSWILLMGSPAFAPLPLMRIEMIVLQGCKSNAVSPGFIIHWVINWVLFVDLAYRILFRFILVFSDFADHESEYPEDQ